MGEMNPDAGEAKSGPAVGEAVLVELRTGEAMSSRVRQGHNLSNQRLNENRREPAPESVNEARLLMEPAFLAREAETAIATGLACKLAEAVYELHGKNDLSCACHWCIYMREALGWR